jgi:hypothetical protein
MAPQPSRANRPLRCESCGSGHFRLNPTDSVNFGLMCGDCGAVNPFPSSIRVDIYDTKVPQAEVSFHFGKPRLLYPPERTND